MRKTINEVKFGAILSYVLIGANAMYGLLIAPFILSSVGTSEYGVYKTISSMTASISVLELGLGGTMQRYIAKFRTDNQLKDCYNFSAMGTIQAVILSCAVLLFGVPLFFSLNSVYGTTFSDAELIRAKQLFVVLIIYIGLHIYENFLTGLISGYNRFAYVYAIKIISLLLKVIIYLVVLPIVKNSLAIVIITLLLEVLTIVGDMLYLKFVLHHKIKLYKWDWALFRESCKYTFWMFLSSIAAQVNSNLDNVMIGALRGTELVTIYSYGLTLFVMYGSLSTSVSSVMLPTVMTTLKDDPDSTNIQALVIKVGRFQFALLGAAIVGFFCVGKQFIGLWLGDGFLDVYPITLILMIPSLFELCVNVCLAVLRAKNRLAFRTFSLLASVLLNVILTWILVSKWSYIGAAFGTGISVLLGSVIAMGIYYKKAHNLDIIKIYLEIFKRLWLCLLVSGAVLFVCSRFICGGIFAFVTNVLIFLIIYLLMLRFFGFKKDELNFLYHGRKKND